MLKPVLLVNFFVKTGFTGDLQNWNQPVDLQRAECSMLNLEIHGRGEIPLKYKDWFSLPVPLRYFVIGACTLGRRWKALCLCQIEGFYIGVDDYLTRWTAEYQIDQTVFRTWTGRWLCIAREKTGPSRKSETFRGWSCFQWWIQGYSSWAVAVVSFLLSIPE